MDLSVFFEPIELDQSSSTTVWNARVSSYYTHFPQWKTADFVLIGLPHDHSVGGFEAANSIRQQLQFLSLPSTSIHLADLGNLKLTDSEASYQDVMSYVLKHLLEEGKKVVWLGGNMSQIIPQGVAFESFVDELNYVSISSQFYLSPHPLSLPHHREFLQHPQIPIFDFTHLGHQSYYVHEAEREFLQDSNFLFFRYGKLASQIHFAEPSLRLAQMVHMDLSAVQASVAPSSELAPPSGFTASQVCQLARYAGLGYYLRSFCLTGYVPGNDPLLQTAKLSAMIIWYVLEGYYHRWNDYPQEDRKNLRKYTVKLQSTMDEIRFFKHKVSQRWWMEVPYPDTLRGEMKQTRLVPCDEEDYEFAKGDDIPERWWATFHKLR